MEKGLISTVQGYSVKDGPGIRSTVFCVGCNLRCPWCSNPELMLPGKKIMEFDLGGKKTRQEVGYEIDSRSLADKLSGDKIFYEETGGGVTFSGGEAALQSKFVAETAAFLRDMGIESTLDTAGNVPWEILYEAARYMEYVLYDVKTFDNRLHEKCIGAGNGLILSNLEKLAQAGKKLIIRLVIVPNYNDDLGDVKRRMELIKSLGEAATRVDVLPYHTLGKGKYKSLGLPYTIEGDGLIADAYWQKFRRLADEANLKIHIAE